jgi:predicted transcriptional regulator
MTQIKVAGRGLWPDCAMVAPTYSQQRRTITKQIDLGHKALPPEPRSRSA